VQANFGCIGTGDDRLVWIGRCKTLITHGST
jgi:hypothetical protein